jgi:mannan polymerase complexes MNN9 subunit
MSRTFRRSNPITIVLAGILCIGFFVFFFSGGDAPTIGKSKSGSEPASNPLSPPSLPFRKSKANAPQAAPPVVHYYMNNVTATRTPIENEETVLILTPLARFYQEYWDNLLKLSYPHHLISLGFIIPKNKEGNAAYAALQAQVTKTQSGPKNKRFSSVTILRQDTESPLNTQSEAERHKMENQKGRRAAMAKARNSLLFTTMGPSTSWILWLDSDIVETPPSLIQDLAEYDVPIIAPNCFQRYYNEDKKAMDIREYDLNNWIDSPTARELGAKMDKDDILLEGYGEMATYRSLMAKMHDKSADPRAKIKLDGVGGTALLVKAEVHRDGAMFPPFAFYHLIETEGFAKMAARLNWESFGLPNYLVRRVNLCSNIKLTLMAGFPLQRVKSATAVYPHLELLCCGGHWAAFVRAIYSHFVAIMSIRRIPRLYNMECLLGIEGLLARNIPVKYLDSHTNIIKRVHIPEQLSDAYEWTLINIRSNLPATCHGDSHSQTHGGYAKETSTLHKQVASLIDTPPGAPRVPTG